MKKLIIGCGYLGTRVARAWKDEGAKVWGLARSEESARRLSDMGINTLSGDVMDPASLSVLNVENIEWDTILHAVARGRNSTIPMRELYIDGLRNVFSQLRHYPRRWIYISSTSVYGQDDGEWVDESSPCQPVTENGKICLEAESIFRETIAAQAACRGHILRLAGIYGPDRLIARMKELQGQTPLKGNPQGWLNLIHVDDAARAILATERHGDCAETILVSDGHPVRRADYYGELARLIAAPAPRFEAATEGWHSMNKRCRNDRMRTCLNVELRYPTHADGLPHAIGSTCFE